MITAHVNEMGIVLRFDSLSDNLSPEAWDQLLNELKSHYIPSFYQYGKRLHVDVGGDPPRTRAVIYFTDKTVTLDEAVSILKKRNITVLDVREASPEK
jgi:hypothetical protein